MINSKVWTQTSDCEAVKMEASKGKCYQAAVLIDKSSIIDTRNKSGYFGNVTFEDRNAAFTIVAYPRDESPGASNRLTLVAYAKSGGHQEFSLNYKGQTSVFYPDKIKSNTDRYGYHFVLGGKKGNIVEDLLLNEQIRIDITERVCENVNSNFTPKPSKPQVIIVEKPRGDPNAGCSDLQDALSGMAAKMYKWTEEDKKSAWLSQSTKKIFDLPGGCIDRDKEVNKIFLISTEIYPKWNHEDKRFVWIRKTIDHSFSRPCRYTSNKIGSKIDAIVSESKEIFEWHQEDKKEQWLLKKIEDILK